MYRSCSLIHFPHDITLRIESSISSQTDSPIEAAHVVHKLTQRDLFIKDAYLVFRALCKLTMKPLNTERSETFFLTQTFILTASFQRTRSEISSDAVEATRSASCFDCSELAYAPFR